MQTKSILLASASPRRKELLSCAGIAFSVCPSHATECDDPTVSVETLVCENAFRKANDVALSHPGNIVLGADTLVTLDGLPLGKPKDRADAKKMLSFLSGRTHEVYTGICLTDGSKTITDCTKTAVRFRTLEEELIDAYVASGECDDKAGAYGIQGKGCIFVEEIVGDYFNVVGLPISKVYKLLTEF